MKCPNCGNEVEKNENFCNNCGTKLNTQTSKFSISLKKIIILSAVVLIIIFIVSICIYLSNNSKPVIENQNMVEEQQIDTYTPNQAGIFRNEANVIEEKFDKNNNMTYYKTKNNNGTFNEETFTYKYDEQNRLIRMSNSKDEYITISYNNDGQISSTTNSTGIETSYFYNDNKLSYKIIKLADGAETIYYYEPYKYNEYEYILEKSYSISAVSKNVNNLEYRHNGYKIYREEDFNTPNYSNAFDLLGTEIMFDTNYFLGYTTPYSSEGQLFPNNIIMGYKTTLKSTTYTYNYKYTLTDNLGTLATTTTEAKYFDKEHKILKQESSNNETEYYKYEKINNNELLQGHLYQSIDMETGNAVYCETKIKYYYENNDIVKKEYVYNTNKLSETEYKELEKDYINYFNENVEVSNYGNITVNTDEVLSYDEILNIVNGQIATADTDNTENNIINNSNSSQQTNISSNNSNRQPSNSSIESNDTSTTTPQPNTSTNQQPNNNNTNVDIPSTPVINEIGHNLNTNLATGEKTANIYIYARDEKDDNLTVTVNGEKVNYSVNSCIYKTNPLNTGTNTFNIVIANKYGKSISRTYTIEI